jgi:hypothetical protein
VTNTRKGIAYPGDKQEGIGSPAWQKIIRKRITYLVIERKKEM